MFHSFPILDFIGMKFNIKYKWVVLFCLINSCLFIFPAIGAEPAQVTLNGKITDASDNKPIPGVIIYFNDLKKGSVSDLDGNYIINDLPETKLRVQVSCIGYNLISLTIDLSVTTVMNFSMTPSVSELSEVVVTGHSQDAEKNRTPIPVTTVPSIQLQQSGASNIIETIASQPGLSMVSTGPAISKPVIRGLGFNRVVVVHDGIRQEGQQWGEEHGVEIDEFSVDKVEILKGPASLTYGSDALAGVINLIGPPVLQQGTIEGKLITGYHTNNGQVFYSIGMGGNNKNIVWNLRWSQEAAHAYKNKFDGYVLNSGFKEYTLSGILGINKTWGYSHLHFSAFSLEPGIVEGERDSITGSFVQPELVNDSLVMVSPSESQLKKYSVHVPYQQIAHYKMVLHTNVVAGSGTLKTIIGWQQNLRREFSDAFHDDQYGLYLDLNTVNYDIKYAFPEFKGLILSTGINGMIQQSLNKGIEFLIPEYGLFDGGIYVIARKSWPKIDISGGIRYDHRSINSEELYLDAEGNPADIHDPGATVKFNSIETGFGGLSGSAGITWQISKLFFSKFNLASGFRAPNIAELGSNGVHEGSFRYEVGNPDLSREQSFQADVTLGINSEHVTGEINLFNNAVRNFIYSRKSDDIILPDSITEGLSVYQFTSGNANLSGGEISIDIHPHPLDWLHFENSFSIVEGILKNQPDSSHYLPAIPAARFNSEIQASFRKHYAIFSNMFIKLEYEYTFEQGNIYSENNTETVTPSYSLFTFGLGTDLTSKNKTLLSLVFNISNIFDEGYQNHMSRLKYAPENFATGRAGVFNTGRNFTFKIIVPFQLK